MLQKKIDRQSIGEVRWYRKGADQPIPVPVLGPDLMDPRQYDLIKEYSANKQNSQITTEDLVSINEGKAIA